MAVALSLLIVLPGLAQTTAGTDGRLGSSSGLQIGVFDDIEDAQKAKLRATSDSENSGHTPTPYVSIVLAQGVDYANIGTGEGAHNKNDRAYLADRRVDPQNTFFRNTLYVSNNVSAFNTVLVNVKRAEVQGAFETGDCVADDSNTAEEDESAKALVTATVKNSRSGKAITFELTNTSVGSGDAVEGAAGQNFQAFFKVVEDGATYDSDPGTDGIQAEEFEEGSGPIFCSDSITRTEDTNSDGTVKRQ